MKRGKAKFLTIMFISMFLSILYVIAQRHDVAWAVYGWCFGSLGLATFASLLYRFMVAK